MSTQKDTPTLERLTETSRTLWLAGLGALATLEEEGERLADTLGERRRRLEADGRQRIDALQKEASKTFDDFVRRGKRVEADGRQRIEQQARSLKDEATTVKESAAQFERRVSGAVEAVLERLEVPSHREVQELDAQIETLAGRVAALTALLEQPPTKTVLHVVPAEDGWAVKQEGETAPMLEAGTKAEMLDKARTLAEAAAPSRLVIHRKDGTVQDQVTFDAQADA